jgi:hypothetical protein
MITEIKTDYANDRVEYYAAGTWYETTVANLYRIKLGGQPYRPSLRMVK